MAKAREVKDEKDLKQAEGTAENVTNEEASAPSEEAVNVAPLKEADEGKVTVVMPRFLFTSDVDVTHHEVVYMGKIYQIQYDVPVEVIAPVADIIKNAIAQKEKTRSLIKSLSGKAKEISNE